MKRIVLFLIAILLIIGFFSIDIKIPLDGKSVTTDVAAYTDRPYALEGDIAVLEGAVLFPIPRHLKAPIFVESSSAVTAFRLLSDVNENDEFLGWNNVDSTLRVMGSNHAGNLNHMTQLIVKEFAAGKTELEAGGPRMSAPLFILSEGDVTVYTVEAFNQIIGPLGDNTKKLAGALASLVIASGLIFGWPKKRRA